MSPLLQEYIMEMRRRLVWLPMHTEDLKLLRVARRKIAYTYIQYVLVQYVSG